MLSHCFQSGKVRTGLFSMFSDVESYLLLLSPLLLICLLRICLSALFLNCDTLESPRCGACFAPDRLTKECTMLVQGWTQLGD